MKDLLGSVFGRGQEPRNNNGRDKVEKRTEPLLDGVGLYKEGDVIGGCYEVRRRLGKGGMGVVYLAYNYDTDEICAVKTVRDDLMVAPAMRRAFKKEALLWINLDEHPFILAARGVVEVSGRLFVEMDYVASDEHGRVSLVDHLANATGPLDVNQALKWAIQFCWGMEHANAHGIKCHRDIKPANILIVQGGTLQISDFGLAMAAEMAWHNSTSHGSSLLAGTEKSGFSFSLVETEGKAICGTPGYMAPEVYRCEVVDTQCDIYSFGLVLWQMATGSRTPPFTVRFGGDMARYLRGIYEKQMSGSPRRVDSPLQLVIQKCLAPDPSARYGSFGQLRSELESLYRQRTSHIITVPDQDEQSTAFLNNKGASLIELGCYMDALQCLDKALRVTPRSPEIWSNRGTCLSRLGHHTEALDSYDKAIQIDPACIYAIAGRAAALRHFGRHHEALECLKLAIDITPPRSALWYDMAKTFLALEDYDTALRCYDKAIDIDPKDNWLWCDRGSCLDELGRHRDAVACYDTALELDPGNVGAWYNKANILRDIGSLEEAMHCYDRALELNPHYADAWANKGMLFGTFHSYQEAVECFTQALSEDTKNAYIWFLKGRCLLRLDRKAEARTCFKKAASLDPQAKKELKEQGMV